MPSFSAFSEANLATCRPEIETLFREVIKHLDCRILEGHRTLEQQQALYAKGRTEPGNIVTNCDGVTNRSNHQTLPSIAVDAVPYPVDWNDINRFYEFAGFVKATAIFMGIEIRWGGDWTMKDYPHWELVL